MERLARVREGFREDDIQVTHDLLQDRLSDGRTVFCYLFKTT